MAATLQVRVITPERVVFDGEATHVQYPGEDGLYGVLPRHAPMITTVASGVLVITEPSGNKHRFFVADGFAQVVGGREVRFAVDSGEDEAEINLTRAQEAAERAKERMGRAQAEGFDLVRAEYAMRRAIMRLRTKQRGMN